MTTTAKNALTRRIHAPFDEVVAAVRAALAEQGFGVLTEIDVKATMSAKLGEEVDDYLILGACNPPLAFRALTADPRIGVLLPCNVVVRSEGGDVLVEAVDPAGMVAMTGQQALEPVAREAEAKLAAALDALG
jgi:uncharacterized protein (DUF302 family)